MLAALLTQTPPRLLEYAMIPSSLDDIVARCLAREQNERWPSVDALAEEMDRVLLTSSDDGATRTIAVGLHSQKWEDEEATLMADALVDRALPPINTLESPVPPAPRHTPMPKIIPRQRSSTTPPPQRPSTQSPPPRDRSSTTPPPQQAQGAAGATAPNRNAVSTTPPPHQPHTPFAHHQQEPPQSDPQQAQQPAQGPNPHSQLQYHQPAPHPGQWQQPRPHSPTPPPPVINPSANVPVDNSGWQVPKAGRPSQPMDPSAWQAYAGNANYQPPNDPGRQSQPYIPPGSPNFIPADRGSGPITPGAMKSYDPNRDAAVGRIIWIVAILIVVAIGFAIYQVLA
jgi:hypothetical protein